jgi:hypothetical protein
MLRTLNSPESLTNLDVVADKWTGEYDAAVKRGFDIINQVTLKRGNVEIMKQLVKLALLRGQTSQIPYDLVGEMGKGVQAYWSGALMNEFPIPLIPAPGSIQNISVTTNLVSSPGVWTPIFILPPNNNPELIINNFILYATSHLSTISGIINTISLYPGPGAPVPGPGVILWTGYQIPPASPPIPNVPIPDTPEDIVKIYENLDFSDVPVDVNSSEVQAIINPDLGEIGELILDDPEISLTDDLGVAALTQLDNVAAESIDDALYEQGQVEERNDEEAERLESSGYKTLDELLRIAGNLAPKLGKDPRVKYENLRSGYIKGVHGLCPQGTQAVVVALTGIQELGRIKGNADWFSFKSPSTGGGRSSFAINVGGKTYYNDKVQIDKSWLTDVSEWEIGDIVVMGYTSGNPYGHIQVWTGFAWVSDFTQRAIQQRKVDFNTIALWRLNENGKEAVLNRKSKLT